MSKNLSQAALLVAGLAIGIAVSPSRTKQVLNQVCSVQDRTFETLHDVSNASYIETDLVSRLIHYVSKHDRVVIGCPVCGGSERGGSDLRPITLEPSIRSVEQAILDAKDNTEAAEATRRQAYSRIITLRRLLDSMGDSQ